MKYRHIRMEAYNGEPGGNDSCGADCRVNFGSLTWPEFNEKVVQVMARVIFAKLVGEPPPVMLDGKVNPAFLEFRRVHYGDVPPLNKRQERAARIKRRDNVYGKLQRVTAKRGKFVIHKRKRSK